jgi:hypothetical protein
VTKTDLGPWPAPGSARGPSAWSDDELAALFHTRQNAGPLTEDCKECSRRFREEIERSRNQAEEEYWRSFREEVEIIRELRAIHPTAPQLAMSANEITEYYRHRSRTPRTDAQRQADIKIVCRVQPGRKSRPRGSRQADKYLTLWQKCIAASGPNMDRVHKSFIQKAMRPKEDGGLGVEKKTARNHLYRLRRSAGK